MSRITHKGQGEPTEGVDSSSKISMNRKILIEIPPDWLRTSKKKSNQRLVNSQTNHRLELRNKKIRSKSKRNLKASIAEIVISKQMNKSSSDNYE